MKSFRFSVEPIPHWLDAARLLAPATDLTRVPLAPGYDRIELTLPEERAASLDARLRGLGFDGSTLRVQVAPALSRARVRAARLEEARARRDTTPGFTRAAARATGEGRFSLTPEALALALGQLARGARVLDACCGSGGNAIGFARAGCTVHALELDAARLDEARHNAAVYGVAEHITFEHADARSRIPDLEADLLFLDPPWGEHYDKRATTLDSLPLLGEVLRLDLSKFRARWLKLPSSFAVHSLPNARTTAWFGEAKGDASRVKFLLAQLL